MKIKKNFSHQLMENNITLSDRKVASNYILNNIFKNSKTKFKWLRVFYIYSENDHKKKLIPTIIKKLKQNKKILIKNQYVIRDYINLDEAVKQILSSHKKKSIVQNICSSKGISILKIAKRLQKKLKKKNLVTFLKKNRVNDKIIGKN